MHALISERYPSVESVPVKCDVSKEEDIKNAVEGAVKKFGRFDIMVSGLESLGRGEGERWEGWRNESGVGLTFLLVLHILRWYSST